MLFIALKMLVGDKLKYLALIAGVSFAALLITQQASIFAGFAYRTGAWIRDTAVADLWVMDEQVAYSEDYKPMTTSALERIRGIDGVEWAQPLYKGMMLARLPDGRLEQCRVIGLDNATLAGAPPAMVDGALTDLRQDRGVIINIDQASTTLGLHAPFDRPMQKGDRIDLNDHEARVVGTYRASREFFWTPTIYTTYTRALSWAPPQRRQLMYVLVHVADGFTTAQVAENIHAVTGLIAHDNAEFERRSMDDLLSKTGVKANFGMTIALGFVIGLLIAGQTFYTFVLDNLRHFGALKAMGLNNRRVTGMLMVQVLLVATVGYGIGVGVAAMTGQVLAINGLAFRMTWHIPLFGGVAVIICCLLSGLLGSIRVMRLEPAVVFKS